MTFEDRDLAEHLGPSPGGADARFRYAVLARMAARKHKRAVLGRALAMAAFLAGVGLCVPLARDAGLSADAFEPLLRLLGAAGVAALIAAVSIWGPGGALMHARGLLRARL